MADPKQMAHDLGIAAAKAAPPIGVTLWAWMGSNLPTAVALATLIYIVLQIAHLVWIWSRERRRGRIIRRDPADE
jgi:hypothetical protein